jgi:hypothetical protein
VGTVVVIPYATGDMAGHFKGAAGRESETEIILERPNLHEFEKALVSIGLDEGGFEICIDGLSFWLMRIAREIGCGTSVQALRERRACQKWADAHQAALPV